MLRTPETRRKSPCELSLEFSDVDIRSIRIGKHSGAAGQALGALNIRKKYRVSVLAISRDHKLIYDLGAETELKSNDILLVISPAERLEKLRELFESGE